jgi:phosphoketolase
VSVVLLPKKPVKNNILQRFIALKTKIKLDTRKLREHLLDELEALFQMASDIARGKTKTQIVDGKQVKVSLKARQKWAQTAAYLAGAMEKIAKDLDEREINEILTEAEKLIAEAKRETERCAGGAEET